MAVMEKAVRVTGMLEEERGKELSLGPWRRVLLFGHSKLPLRSCMNLHFWKTGRNGTGRGDDAAVSEKKTWTNVTKPSNLKKFCLSFDKNLILREAQSCLFLNRQIQVTICATRTQNFL